MEKPVKIPEYKFEQSFDEAWNKVVKEMREKRKADPLVVYPYYTQDHIAPYILDDCNCLHARCLECHGTGKKFDESICIHNIACSCSRCSPR